MIKLKTDPENPSSNFETGISSNFLNVLWKFVTIFFFFGTGVYSYSSGLFGLNTWWSLSIWYLAWFFPFILVVVKMNSYKKLFQENLDINYFADFNDDELGCLINIFLFILFPIILPLQVFFKEEYQKLANRFVCYKGKYFVFASEKPDIYEIDTYNPFFLFWINLFRNADPSDAHAKMIDKELAKKAESEVEDVLELDPKVLKDFKKEISDFLNLELRDGEETFFRNENNFIDFLKNDKGNQFSKGMELYARKIHKEKILSLNPK